MNVYRRTSLNILSGLALALLIVFGSCRQKRKIISIDPGFSKYIEAYTSGVVSKRNTIRIKLASDVPTTHAVNETIKDELFEFSPQVTGTAYWADERTIEFKPGKDLEPGEFYEVRFKLGEVYKVPEKFETFSFNVQVTKPLFTVEMYGLKVMGESRDKMIFTGSVLTADIEESKQVEKMLTARYLDSPAKIIWQHNEEEKTHDFAIEDLRRSPEASSLHLEWDGKALNVDKNGKQDIQVPAKGDFKVLGVRAVQGEEEFALVQFSDAIAINQDLTGLVNISEQDDISYAIQGSEVKVYTAGRLDGSYKVSINHGILNRWQIKLGKSYASNVFFENRLPSVSIFGKGTILPNGSGKLILPFDAVNLNAVDVSVIKIFENNVTRFLQSNEMDGDYELRMVAQPLVKATVRLDNDQTLNLHKKNRFSLDLDKYIKAERGAIYRINIGFRPGYSLYTCLPKPRQKAALIVTDSAVDTAVVATTGDSQASDGEADEEAEEYEYTYSENSQAVDDDDEFWSRYDTYYPYGYKWSERDNPCSRSYFNKERFASRNILATNIGLTAKRGTENTLLVAATNILTTEPISGVELSVLDYQLQPVGKGTTGSDGIATMEAKRKPYLLVAKDGEEKSYLKLDEGLSLPLSRFDVSGTEVKAGIKAFIFGERGVWRPGDSLYLSCIVEDKQGKLPEDHPVEMELYAPNGQLYKRMVQANNEDGLNVFKTATDEGAPTGNWNCKIKIGGAVFEKKIRIETVMPNRLKIDLSFGTDPQLGKGLTTPGILTAKWLFGAPANSLKARVDAQLYRTVTTFPKFKSFVFDNPTAHFESQSKTVFDGQLSPEGVATVNTGFAINTEAPGMLTANLLVKVFEPGGNFSIDNVAYPYNPYNSYMGIEVPEGPKPWGYLAAGKPHSIAIVNVDTRGNLLPGPGSAEVELYRIQWKWWWDETGDELSNFTQDTYNKLIKKQAVVLSGGRGVYNLNISSENWGRYLVLVRDTKSGHVTGKTFYVDDPYWTNRDKDDDQTAASMLSFTSNKETYAAGETVTLNIPSTKGGKALISIESGNKVLKTYWTETTQGQTKFSFQAAKEMAPNVYVNVSLFQPHAQTINDLPIRMYGVIPVMVTDKNTLLKPVIRMPDVLKPEQENTITVMEEAGKKMSYLVAIVDEGLLDLTRHKTPDPHKAFYAREALGVKSWDLFDNVIGAWGGDIGRVLTIGGDNEAPEPGKKKANRFKPVVSFMGPFTTNGSANTHRVTLPPYMGSLRVMVIGAGRGAYGFAEKTVAVKKPLMMLATMPRVLAPAEQIKIPVTVFATDNRVKKVSLSIRSNPFIEAVGATSQNIVFQGIGEQQVYFNARVKAVTGIGKVRITAAGASDKTYFEVEVDIRNPKSPVTSITEQILQPGKILTTAVAAVGAGNTNKAVLEVSSIPAINLQSRLAYLIQYPHGCIEQVTSSAFPQLVLNQLTELDERQRADVDFNIKKAIERIRNFQGKDGGFSYWPNEALADEWGTNYAGHFLLEAAAQGYNISSSLLQQWKYYERLKANAWNETGPVYYGGDLVQAYRLYLLAFAKAPEIGAMNRLKEYRFLTPEAKWRLAAAYYLIGQNAVALQLVSRLSYNFPERNLPGITYGSQLRDQAMVLETLTLMNRKAEGAQLVRSIAAQLSSKEWYSTQTTAYALIAISRYAGQNASGSKLMFGGTAAGRQFDVSSTLTLAQVPLTFVKGTARFSLQNKGNNLLYLRIINSGQPVTGDTIRVSNNSSLLDMSVQFLSSAGAMLDPATIKQGTDFVAKVTVKNTGQRGTYGQMALSQIFPSGWEILNTRLYNSQGRFQSSPADYMDIRDDRVYHYFDIRQGETLTYYVQLNAAYPGRFYWPGVYCEAMYDHTVSGASNGRWVQVVQ